MIKCNYKKTGVEKMEKKNILLGVCSSIAAYKSASLAHLLTKKGYNVDVIMTENATKIIAPITFERLTGNRCIVDTFEKTLSYDVKHISLAKKADMVLIAPATANCIGKIANGIADDMLTTTFMACECKKIVSPAMNTRMFNNPVVKDNMKKLESYGIDVINPASGYLACGDIGEGKMPEPEVLLSYILKVLVHFQASLLRARPSQGLQIINV